MAEERKPYRKQQKNTNPYDLNKTGIRNSKTWNSRDSKKPFKKERYNPYDLNKAGPKKTSQHFSSKKEYIFKNINFFK